MRRLFLVAVLGLVAAAPALAVDRKFWITAITIGDANLHWSKGAYVRHWGKPVRLDRLENGYSRLHFAKRHADVYFKSGITGAAAILTWDRRDRTLDGIGPCSTVAAFRKAYPHAPTAVRLNGRAVAYRLGRLIFAVERKRIGDVMLAVPAVSPYVALNATACR